MSYVDGFVIAVPKKNIAMYRRMANTGRKVWMKCGALQYFECAGDDLKVKFGVPFTRMMKTKPSETVFFSFIVYKSRAHRDQVNKKVMSDPSMAQMPKTMPFDMKRMVYGGFKVLVQG